MPTDKENIYEKISGFTKKISEGYRISFRATLIAGLIAHIMCYTNIWPSHDDASIYGNAKLNLGMLISGITGARPLAVPIGITLKGYYLPVICGLIFLLAFSVGSWKFCQMVNIKHPVAIIIVAALFVTFPGATAINLYSGNSIIYSVTFLASIYTLYFFYKDIQKHYLWAVMALFVVIWTYPGYVSLVLSLFLSIEMINIVFGKDEAFKIVMRRHIIMLVMSAAILSSPALLTKITVAITGDEAQARIQNVIDLDISSNIPKQQGSVFHKLLKNYTRNASSILDFWKFEISRNVFVLCLSILCLVLLAVAVCIIYFKKKPFKNKAGIKFGIVIFDMLCMPLALNTIGFVGPTHLLMQFSFITPWLLVMIIANRLIEEYGEWRLTRIASAVTMAAMSMTIIGWQFTANVAYVQAYANYTAGISVANRIVYRIESIDGYRPGETSVVFLGDARKISYRDYDESDGFGVLNNYTAGMGPWYEAAFTYEDVFTCYIKKELNVDMLFIKADEDSDIYKPSSLENLEPYPSEKCYAWQGDVLYFRVAE